MWTSAFSDSKLTPSFGGFSVPRSTRIWTRSFCSESPRTHGVISAYFHQSLMSSFRLRRRRCQRMRTMTSWWLRDRRMGWTVPKTPTRCSGCHLRSTDSCKILVSDLIFTLIHDVSSSLQFELCYWGLQVINRLFQRFFLCRILLGRSLPVDSKLSYYTYVLSLVR